MGALISIGKLVGWTLGGAVLGEAITGAIGEQFKSEPVEIAGIGVEVDFLRTGAILGTGLILWGIWAKFVKGA